MIVILIMIVAGVIIGALAKTWGWRFAGAVGGIVWTIIEFFTYMSQLERESGWPTAYILRNDGGSILRNYLIGYGLFILSMVGGVVGRAEYLKSRHKDAPQATPQSSPFQADLSGLRAKAGEAWGQYKDEVNQYGHGVRSRGKVALERAAEIVRRAPVAASDVAEIAAKPEQPALPAETATSVIEPPQDHGDGTVGQTPSSGATAIERSAARTAATAEVEATLKPHSGVITDLTTKQIITIVVVAVIGFVLVMFLISLAQVGAI